MSDEKPDDVVGHKTFSDGPLSFRHEPLLRAEADEFMRRADEADARRRELMPNEKSAITTFFDAWLRLKEFGWKEAIYCPKDGSQFDIIEAGSTGIHRCHYQGVWPDGSWWISDEHDMSPSHPTLFRLDPDAEAERKAKMKAAAERYRAEAADDGLLGDCWCDAYVMRPGYPHRATCKRTTPDARR